MRLTGRLYPKATDIKTPNLSKETVLTSYRQFLGRHKLLLAVAAGVLALGVFHNFPVAELKAGYHRIFPRDTVLFAYVPGTTGDALPKFELMYPIERQKQDGLRIRVQLIKEGEILGSLNEVLDTFERTHNVPGSSKLFVQLPPPFSMSKKKFREDIDTQKRYTGDNRVRLLARIVPIVGSDERKPRDSTPCQQFDDDLAYSDWNFGGYALRLDDQTVELLAECLKEVLPRYVAAKN